MRNFCSIYWRATIGCYPATFSSSVVTKYLTPLMPPLRAVSMPCHAHARAAYVQYHAFARSRVEIIMTDHHKHMLPVRGSCSWHHSNGLVVDEEECMSVADKPVQDHADLWNCVERAGCEIWDDRPQFVMMRDPRPMAVSSFFYVQTHPETRGGKHPALNMTVDDAVMMMLPGIARYIGLRFNLFQGLLERQSEVFWYDDALADPLQWHYRWFAFAGLNLPGSVVRAASDASVRGEFDFWTEGGPNKHPGGKEPSVKRSWKDEVSPKLHAEIDEITRRWLPPVVLAKIGVPVEAQDPLGR